MVCNLRQMPEDSLNVCPACGSTGLVRRQDDEPSVVRERLLSYERDTFPVLSSLRDGNRLQVIDAMGTPEEVEERLGDALESLLLRDGRR